MDLELGVHAGSEQVLGPVDQRFDLAKWAVQGGRVAIAAQAPEIGAAALELAIARAKRRCQFERPIADRPAIQWMLADARIELEAARMLTMVRALLRK
jgi:acyl-CoA dehydrogenase